MTSVFEVLAEPRRRRILELVRDGERSVGELAQALAASQPAVSKHLRVLREAGLVEVRVAEQRRLYRLRAEPLRELEQWLAPYRALWSESLDRLEHHLDVMDDVPRSPDPAPRRAGPRTGQENGSMP
ncbi:ArsR/SmtB family transcription factor [Kitasatospora sp. NBC_01266]|uniref:ArsR/SmtB family transcription factor n=1 Tax=Kitasatospora sp. NBC_01266 TaxID=2903572 RepID=UPI002E3209C9|nr:metalloregulator ArsR/SmtB family transcription factor [Kitasatospora sp. NBC_01266]